MPPAESPSFLSGVNEACFPLTVGIQDRRRGTVAAMNSTTAVPSGRPRATGTPKTRAAILTNFNGAIAPRRSPTRDNGKLARVPLRDCMK